MNRLHALLGPGGGHLGLSGVLGIALLVAVCGFHVSALDPQEVQIADLQRESMQLQRQAKVSDQDVPQGPAEKLAAFYGAFPPAKELPDLLEKIFEAARKETLVLEHGEYRALKDSVGELMRYQVTLPVQGTYPQIRKFLRSALAGIPALSLDSIQFDRRKIGDATVEAKIKLVVYLGKNS